jgi:hypothetical protein
LVAGSIASLAANVVVAEPTVIDRVIAAWFSFALTASYELLTPGPPQRGQCADGWKVPTAPRSGSSPSPDGHGSVAGLTLVGHGLTANSTWSTGLGGSSAAGMALGYGPP